MIELRWVKTNQRMVPGLKLIDYKHLGYFKLQSRGVINILEVSNELQEPIWSEWTDVPTSIEE